MATLFRSDSAFPRTFRPVILVATDTLSYLQAIVIGILQGVTELFPISSLGHSVLIPELVGVGHARRPDSRRTSRSTWRSSSVCTSRPRIALLVLLPARLGRDRPRLRHARSRNRRIETSDERMAWLLIVGDDPGRHRRARVRAHAPHAVREAARGGDLPHDQRGHPLRGRAGPATRSDPRARRRAHAPRRAGPRRRPRPRHARAQGGRVRRRARQIAALFAGHQPLGRSRWSPASLRGLDHEDAARLSFLLATPDHPRRRGLQDPRPRSAATATASAARSSSGASAAGSPPTCRCASSCGSSRPGRSRRSRSTASCSASR